MTAFVKKVVKFKLGKASARKAIPTLFFKIFSIILVIPVLLIFDFLKILYIVSNFF